MLKRAFESLLALLDWSWPFPLGIFFGVLVFAVSAGTWLAVREPRAPRRPPHRTDSPAGTQSPARAVAPQAPAESAPSAPAGSSVPAQGSPVGAASGEIPAATTRSQSEQTAGESSAPKSKEQTSRLPRQPEKPGVTSASKLPAVANRLPTAQEAKLRDTLTRGRWYMEHQQYRPALEEYQAVLEMDPANKEAQDAMQRARAAGANPQPQPEKPVAASSSKPPAAASQTPAAQEAKLRDTLTRARWYMKHQQYGPALEEFQAVLQMDPANKEAQAAIQQAHAASGNR